MTLNLAERVLNGEALTKVSKSISRRTKRLIRLNYEAYIVRKHYYGKK